MTAGHHFIFDPVQRSQYFLDIFLIVVVKLGTAGAAYATVISQAVSAVLCFIVMFRKYDILRTTREDYYCDFMRSAGCCLWEFQWL